VSTLVHARGDSRSGSLRYQWRIVRVLASTSFKLRYADSALGYIWSLLRPLALFGILYAVFGRALGIGSGIPHYPLFLLLGIVLFTFFSDATTRTMTSVVEQSQLMRRLAFPRVIIPISASVMALITFVINLIAVTAFLAIDRVAPAPSWVLLAPLMVELYVFVLGLSLVLATLYARLRDVGAIWEVVVRVCFYAFAIIFPIQVLPLWAERVVLANPFSQVMQDARAIVIGGEIVTAGDVFGGTAGYLVPLAIAFATFVVGLVVFRKQEAWFAERV
jgi:ABC-2 type transport system permease protein